MFHTKYELFEHKYKNAQCRGVWWEHINDSTSHLVLLPWNLWVYLSFWTECFCICLSKSICVFFHHVHNSNLMCNFMRKSLKCEAPWLKFRRAWLSWDYWMKLFVPFLSLPSSSSSCSLSSIIITIIINPSQRSSRSPSISSRLGPNTTRSSTCGTGRTTLR